MHGQSSALSVAFLVALITGVVMFMAMDHAHQNFDFIPRVLVQ